MPRADDLPSLDLGFIGTRCTTNPPGVKGCGEATDSTQWLQWGMFEK
jgi:CO/xanthine dehydrogenase Mo-binding subunit